MGSDNNHERELYEQDSPPSVWETREGMMSEEEVKRLAAEKGKGAEGEVRADQTGDVGPEPEGDPVRRADMEGGVAGRYKQKLADQFEANGRQNHIEPNERQNRT